MCLFFVSEYKYFFIIIFLIFFFFIVFSFFKIMQIFLLETLFLLIAFLCINTNIINAESQFINPVCVDFGLGTSNAIIDEYKLITFDDLQNNNLRKQFIQCMNINTYFVLLNNHKSIPVN